jgi:hypothetical protein
MEQPERKSTRRQRATPGRGDHETSNLETHKMVVRGESKTITMKADLKADQDEPVEERVGQKKRVETGRFRLQVDRQTKGSYATYAQAEEAGLSIKRSYPIVQVAVYDPVASVNTIIDLPKAE